MINKFTFIMLLPVLALVYMIMTDQNIKKAKELAELKSTYEPIIEAQVKKDASEIFLEPTIDNWMLFKDFAEANNAIVTWHKEGFYQGDHAFYSGVLEARTKYAIAIVGKLQSEIPLVLHSIDINDGIAKIKVSVLGVDQ